MNLVVGATGMVGMEICRQLIADGKPVRGLVRPTTERAKMKTLRALGVQIVEGDLQDRASLDAACLGVDAIISTAATTLSRQPHDSIRATDLEGQMSLVDAAKGTDVRHFVYISVGGQIPATTAFIQAKRAVEAHVRTSGMVYTIFRPAPFMEVWLGPALGFDIANASARIFGSGDGKLSWIALGDVARMAAGSVGNPAAYDTTFEVGGPDWLSHNEVIHLCEEMSGRTFAVEGVPVEALQAQLENAKDEYERAFAGLMLLMVEGEHEHIDMRHALRAFPLRLVSVREYVRSMLTVPVVL